MLSISIIIIVLLLLLLSLSLSMLRLIVESSKLGAWQTKKKGLQRSPLIDESPSCPGRTEF